MGEDERGQVQSRNREDAKTKVVGVAKIKNL